MATLSRKSKATMLKFAAIDHIKYILTLMAVLNQLLDQTKEFLVKKTQLTKTQAPLSLLYIKQNF